ncbi:hypothetical protein ACWWC9_001818 [Cronobacter sakazakii]|uniref:hypothetical protein n=1 Tax=Cronobacter sakazakii TaxID=28141 RepID=UPI0028A0D0D7|nr:hypothetical protein [Cronobacter sakazakii]
MALSGSPYRHRGSGEGGIAGIPLPEAAGKRRADVILDRKVKNFSLSRHISGKKKAASFFSGK